MDIVNLIPLIALGAMILLTIIHGATCMTLVAITGTIIHLPPMFTYHATLTVKPAPLAGIMPTVNHADMILQTPIFG